MNLPSALAAKYAPPKWALFFEVADSTGYAKSRSADAIAMGLWPSIGLDLIGFEIKTARGDWLSELKDPEKSHAIGRFCDKWYLVTTKDVAKPEEIPSLWGHMVFSGERLRIEKEAPTRNVVEPVTRNFLASLMRCGSNESAVEERAQKIAESKRAELEKRIQINYEQRLKVAARDGAAAQSALEEFERVSGIKVNTWTAGNIGKAFRLFMELGTDRANLDKLIAGVDHIRALHANNAHNLEQQVANLKAAFVVDKPVPHGYCDKCWNHLGTLSHFNTCQVTGDQVNTAATKDDVKP